MREGTRGRAAGHAWQRMGGWSGSGIDVFNLQLTANAIRHCVLSPVLLKLYQVCNEGSYRPAWFSSAILMQSA